MPNAGRPVASKKRRAVNRPLLGRLVSAANLGSRGRRAPGRRRVALTLAAKWAATYIVVAGLVFAASWTRFPNFFLGSVDYVERGYLSLIDFTTVSRLHPDLRIIYIDDKDFAAQKQSRKWRARHARILRALVGAGASVVAFDFTFTDAYTDDPLLAAAIRDAGATRIVLGAEPAPSPSDPSRSYLPVSASLAAVLKPGQLASLAVGDTGTALSTPVLRRYVRLANARATTMGVFDAQPTFPLQIKLAWEASRRGKPIVARINDGRGQIDLWDGSTRVEAIPCAIHLDDEGGGTEQHANVLFRRLRSTALEHVSKPYDLVESWIDESLMDNFKSNYQGKVVLIGSNFGDYTLQLANETVYGYAIHASIVNSLLERSHPREPGVVGQIALLCLVALAAGMGRVVCPRGDYPLPVSLLGWKINCPITLLALCAAYLLVSVFVYSRMQVVLDVTYGAAAIVAGYYVRNWFLEKGQVESAPARQHGAAARSHGHEGT